MHLKAIKGLPKLAVWKMQCSYNFVWLQFHMCGIIDNYYIVFDSSLYIHVNFISTHVMFLSATVTIMNGSFSLPRVLARYLPLIKSQGLSVFAIATVGTWTNCINSCIISQLLCSQRPYQGQGQWNVAFFHCQMASATDSSVGLLSED